MPVKDRMLVLLQTLQQRSDDEPSFLTTAQLRAALEKEGHECSIRTLRRDVKALQNCGYEIDVRETNGMPTKYAYLSREWSTPELQILVDAVCAAQFIPQKRSEDLIRKLSRIKRLLLWVGCILMRKRIPLGIWSPRLKRNRIFSAW